MKAGGLVVQLPSLDDKAGILPPYPALKPIDEFWCSRNLSLFRFGLRVVGVRVHRGRRLISNGHASQIFGYSWISFCMRSSSSSEKA